MWWNRSKNMCSLCYTANSGGPGDAIRRYCLSVVWEAFPSLDAPAGPRQDQQAVHARIHYFTIRWCWQLESLEYSGQASFYQILSLLKLSFFWMQTVCSHQTTFSATISVIIMSYLSKGKIRPYKQIYRSISNSCVVILLSQGERFLFVCLPFHYKAL